MARTACRRASPLLRPVSAAFAARPGLRELPRAASRPQPHSGIHFAARRARRGTRCISAASRARGRGASFPAAGCPFLGAPFPAGFLFLVAVLADSPGSIRAPARVAAAPPPVLLWPDAAESPAASPGRADCAPPPPGLAVAHRAPARSSNRVAAPLPLPPWPLANAPPGEGSAPSPIVL